MRNIFVVSISAMVFPLTASLYLMPVHKKEIAQTSTSLPAIPVTGLWEGTYQTDQVEHIPTYASMAIYPDGTIITRNKVVGTKNNFSLSKGRWKLTGNTFTYRDTTIIYSGGYVIEKGSLTLNNNGTFTNGTWQDLFGQNYTGTFQNMKRVNKN
ncbi:MAG: hypothetical protein WDM90_19110 [Ferruginibacter sp.]